MLLMYYEFRYWSTDKDKGHTKSCLRQIFLPNNIPLNYLESKDLLL